jgi:hypothetical protein
VLPSPAHAAEPATWWAVDQTSTSSKCITTDGPDKEYQRLTTEMNKTIQQNWQDSKNAGDPVPAVISPQRLVQGEC